jgi:hypothetical protein
MVSFAVLIAVVSTASISEPEGSIESALAEKSWLQSAIDSIESTFKGEFLLKIFSSGG